MPWPKGGNAVDERLERLTRGRPARPDAQAEQQPQQRRRVDLFPTVGRMLEPGNRANKLRNSLARAGIPLRPGEFVGLSAAWVGLLSVAGFFLIARTADGALIGALVGVLTPSALVSFLQKQRQAALQMQLPDALMIMAAGVRSGFSFIRCLQLVAEEMKSPIAPEFARTVHEITIGRSIQEALVRLVQRTDSYDLDLVVTAVTIQIEVGGNLATVLETIAETIRERFRLKGEIASLTAEGRLSGWVLFLAPAGMFMFLLKNNPEYLNLLLKDDVGRWMLIIAFSLQVIGGLVIKKLLDIDV
jgi:tight adherence protein B